MPKAERTIYVYADWSGGQPALMGRLYAGDNRGKEIFSFEYSKNWIHSNSMSFVFDPDLYFYEGRQYASEKPLFGVFSDSCPDRWGRLLMKRREEMLAREEGRKPRALTESDFLLGVFDEARTGALRFSLKEGGPFLSEDQGLSTPPWATLRTLEAASLAFESDEGKQVEKWLKQLIVPGSSLGGARPKASVQAPDGSLWIAKFPSKNDEWDCGAWEAVVHALAAKCGLRVPDSKLEFFSGKGRTFLVKRFDRAMGRRIHFASAMALLGRTDGVGAEGASYLDIASFIKTNGASPKQDLKELWNRMVFSMAVSNTDDHLRNHGFLLTWRGWELSPMYDVNPDIYGSSLSLGISADDNSIDFDLAIETAKYYDIGIQDAKNSAAHIQKTVGDKWHSIAAGYGLSKSAIERMEPAFLMEYKAGAGQ